MNKHQLRKVRKTLGLSQAQLGKVLGVHPLTVSKWERGAAKPEGATAQLFRVIGRRIEEQPPPPDTKETILAALAGPSAGAGLEALLETLFGGAKTKRAGPPRTTAASKPLGRPLPPKSLPE
jgi:DNA-binding XRE family transcriptional regulator